MKYVCDDFREQINNISSDDMFGTAFIRTDRIHNIINAIEDKWCKEFVRIGTYKQVAWERDIAIEQLHELGYEFGEKIREDDCCEWEHVRWHASCHCKCNDNHITMDYDTVLGFKVCPYCAKPIKVKEVT